MTGGKSRSRLDRRKLGNKEVIAKALTQMKEGRVCRVDSLAWLNQGNREKETKPCTFSSGRTSNKANN